MVNVWQNSSRPQGCSWIFVCGLCALLLIPWRRSSCSRSFIFISQPSNKDTNRIYLLLALRSCWLCISEEHVRHRRTSSTVSWSPSEPPCLIRSRPNIQNKHFCHASDSAECCRVSSSEPKSVVWLKLSGPCWSISLAFYRHCIWAKEDIVLSHPNMHRHPHTHIKMLAMKSHTVYLLWLGTNPKTRSAI